MGKKIFGLLIAWKSFIILSTLAAISILPLNTSFIPNEFYRDHIAYLAYIWGNFDGVHYLDIAQSGYLNFLQPFFPLYPLLIYFTNTFLHLRPVVSGIVISHSFFFLALFLIYKIMKIDRQKNLFFLLVMVILFFPTSFFYGAIYNDALFFSLATATVYFSRKQQWIFASTAGALATLARLNGLALVFLIGVEYFTVHPLNQRSIIQALRSSLLSVVLIPLSFVGFLYYNQIAFGDWQRPFEVMKIWNQSQITFPLQVVWRYMKILVHPQYEITYAVAFFELLFVALYLFLLIFSYKKIRISYWVFCGVSILIPSLTGTFQGMPRYGLHLYPFFLSLALFLNTRSMTFRLVYGAVSMVLLFIFLTLFTRGYFIS